MAAKGWSRTFDDPIVLPGGGELKTLRDAGHYIARPPKRQHDALEWQAAIEALTLVVEKGDPTMLARIGIMRALNAKKRDVRACNFHTERQPASIGSNSKPEQPGDEQ